MWIPDLHSAWSARWSWFPHNQSDLSGSAVNPPPVVEADGTVSDGHLLAGPDKRGNRGKAARKDSQGEVAVVPESPSILTRGEQGQTVKGKAVDSPAPPIREEEPRGRADALGAGRTGMLDSRAVATGPANRSSSPFVGEGVDAAPSGQPWETEPPPLRRTSVKRRIIHDTPRITNETIRPIEGETCVRCGADAFVVIRGAMPWAYCEQHGIDRVAFNVTTMLVQARLDRTEDVVSGIEGRLGL
jgi:hypothetical protein